jgi:hypothetical protein
MHVKKWGPFVRSAISGHQATLSVLTEVANDGKGQGSDPSLNFAALLNSTIPVVLVRAKS